ncbi:MAG: HAD family hydrolase [Alicyclobacillus sp.]|nr:HAD family hydrolase [Alicyclobacillus sp.]
MGRYDVIFLDLDHTLVDTRGQYRLGLQQVIDRLYQGNVPDAFIPTFLAHHGELWGQYDQRQITMKDLRRERFLRTWRDLGVVRTVDEADAFQAAYDETFESTLFAYPETLALVQALARQHRLGIITNGSPDLQERKLRITGLAPYFPPNSITVSELVGLAKPHPSVYQSACDAMQVHPTDALMIGDNFRADVEGARAFGMDAIWYVPDPEMAREMTEKVGQKPLSTMAEVLAEVERLEQRRAR